MSTDSIEGGWGDVNRSSASAPTLGSTVWSAPITYVQNEAGSSSAWSSDSQATNAVSADMPASQSASRVVLPKPAGAATSVTFTSVMRSRRSRSRARGTTPRRLLGTKNFVSSRCCIALEPNVLVARHSRALFVDQSIRDPIRSGRGGGENCRGNWTCVTPSRRARAERAMSVGVERAPPAEAQPLMLHGASAAPSALQPVGASVFMLFAMDACLKMQRSRARSTGWPCDDEVRGACGSPTRLPPG